jgi:hypothetical protein
MHGCVCVVVLVRVCRGGGGGSECARVTACLRLCLRNVSTASAGDDVQRTTEENACIKSPFLTEPLSYGVPRFPLLCTYLSQGR